MIANLSFEEWIYDNHPMFDIDLEDLQIFIDWHFKEDKSHNENFKYLQEWIEEN